MDENYNIVVALIIIGSGFVIWSNLRKHEPVEKPE